MKERNKIITETVSWMFQTFESKLLLELQLEMDGTQEDIFFEELTEQLAERFPEHFVTVNDSDLIVKKTP